MKACVEVSGLYYWYLQSRENSANVPRMLEESIVYEACVERWLNGLEDCAVLNRGHRFVFLQIVAHSHPLTLIPGNLMPLLTFFGTKHIYHVYTDKTLMHRMNKS